MLRDAITVNLRLDGLVVLAEEELAGRIEVTAQYAQEEAACPRCQRPTWQVHEWRRQRKRDAELWGKPVWIVLWKRRFRCRACRYVFTEDDPVCGRRRRTTYRLRRQVAKEAQEATVKAVSRWHGVSEGLVQRSWLETYGQPSPVSKPHVFLGLDAFCVRRPGVMWTGLWDLQTRKAVAVISGQRQAEVEKLLERYVQRDQVRAVVIDLAEPERQAIHTALPQAAIVADHFHVIALASQALLEVRGGRRLRGNDAWLLHRNVERLSAADGARLAGILQADASLASAWRLKEGLRAMYRARGGDRAAAALAQWLEDAKASGLAPFQRIARTLSKWDKEVLNYWRFPLTNAMVEGKHNRVKVLKRRAYGYRNDRTFSLRILNLIHT
ncbi:MAG: ISL3 family transposase [Chloroflexota bacterium]